nr:lycopene cyclase family protein [Cecembia rubra]
MSKHLLTYDYIITGFGCAGMSLVYHLLNSQLRDKKILIIDISDKKTNDRTWCYWAETPLDIHPKNSPLTFWKNIVISHGEKKLKKDLGKLNYYHIRSSDFYREILAKIKNFTNIHFIQDSVQTIESSPNNSVTVSTKNHGSFYAEMVFNSVPDSSTNLRHHKILKQVFLGWKVKTKKACFEVDTAIMMDFDQKKHQRLPFFMFYLSKKMKH